MDILKSAIRLERVVFQNFRCFEFLNLKLGATDEQSGLTVIVAKNGQGKTAVLDGIRYLMSKFVARFSEIKTPSPKATDFRSAKIANPQSVNLKLRTVGADGETRVVELGDGIAGVDVSAQFMGLTAFMRKGGVESGSASEIPWVRWDVLRRKDKTELTTRVVDMAGMGIGTKFLSPYVDKFIESDLTAEPMVLPVIAYYGTDRRLVRQKPGPVNALSKANRRQNIYNDALTTGLNYRQLVEWIFKLDSKELREMKDVKDTEYQSLEKRTINLAISKMLPGFSNLQVTMNPLNLTIDYETNGLICTNLVDEQLSDGYKIVLTLVLDIVARILEGNASLAGMTPETLLEVPGIVMIDEVDLHLHPYWQQTIIPDLRNTFPNIQFIVTTHSPQVVSSVPRECVRIIDAGNVRETISQTDGVESQLILADIFGVNSVPEWNPWARKLDEYSRLMSAPQVDAEREAALKAELTAHFGASYAPLKRIELIGGFKRKRS